MKMIPDATFLSLQEGQRSRSDTGQVIRRCVFIQLFDILPPFVLQLLKCEDLLLFFGFWTVGRTKNVS